MYVQKSKWLVLMSASLLVAACASGPTTSGSKNAWTNEALAAALSTPTRKQEDRDRDADRKPAQLMTFFGVERGMTAVDVMASGGFMTEVLSITVGPTGKVYAQNPVAFLQYNNGMYGKAIGERLANNRLPNVVRTDGDMSTIAPNSIDVAVTAMNLHDLYNRDAKVGQAFVKGVFDALKPGGVFGVVDHAGVAGADNAKLHRMLKQQAIDVAKAAGFVVEAESDVLAHAADDHTKAVFDPTLRGHTDQFTLKLRKPKK
jgi:predicted methyltransferase